MTASLAAPAEILREIFQGTGASLPSEVDRSDEARRGFDFAGLFGDPARTVVAHESGRFVLTVASFAGGAFLIALAALIISYQSMEQLAYFRGLAQAIDAGLAELPRLKGGIDVLSAELTEERAAQKPILEASRAVNESAKSLEAEIHQSIESVNHKLDSALDAVKAQGDDLSLRLGKVEADQSAQAAAFQSARLRTATTVSPPQNNANPGTRALAAFHLKSIKAGIATVVGPDGAASVSVGDQLFSLGRVLKIGKRGRKGILVTEQGKLTISWPRAISKPKSPAGAL